MIHRLGLSIIAALLSFTLSSIETTIDEETLLAVGNLVCKNLLPQNSETYFIDDTDAGCASLISNKTKKQPNILLKNLSSSNRFRQSVGRISNIYNPVLNNGYNAIHNTLHSLVCFAHSRHPSGFNEPNCYLIRLRKLII